MVGWKRRAAAILWLGWVFLVVLVLVALSAIVWSIFSG
jgi:hypothetical protein